MRRHTVLELILRVSSVLLESSHYLPLPYPSSLQASSWIPSTSLPSRHNVPSNYEHGPDR